MLLNYVRYLTVSKISKMCRWICACIYLLHKFIQYTAVVLYKVDKQGWTYYTYTNIAKKKKKFYNANSFVKNTDHWWYWWASIKWWDFFLKDIPFFFLNQIENGISLLASEAIRRATTNHCYVNKLINEGSSWNSQ